MRVLQGVGCTMMMLMMRDRGVASGGVKDYVLGGK